jgi:hypothetical protein
VTLNTRAKNELNFFIFDIFIYGIEDDTFSCFVV